MENHERRAIRIWLSMGGRSTSTASRPPMDNHVRMMPLLMVFAWGYGISCGAKRRIRLWNSARVFARPPWISRRSGYPYGIPWGYEMLSKVGGGWPRAKRVATPGHFRGDRRAVGHFLACGRLFSMTLLTMFLLPLKAPAGKQHSACLDPNNGSSLVK